jgi:hypothetical protein
VSIEPSYLCGSGVEYLHLSPASRRRLRKGNPVLGGITGPPCSWGYKYGYVALQVGRVSNLRMNALARTRSNCKR